MTTKDDIDKALEDTQDVVDNADKLLDEIKDAENNPDPISPKTVAALVVSLVVLANTIFMILGIDKRLDENTWYQAGSIIALIANLGYATWKNHNITVDARKRQKVGDIVVPKK